MNLEIKISLEKKYQTRKELSVLDKISIFIICYQFLSKILEKSLQNGKQCKIKYILSVCQSITQTDL